MAIFERKLKGQEVIDDTLRLVVAFEKTQNVDGHTEYIIRVQRGPFVDNSWLICKRYNDFFQLHHAVVNPSKLQIRLPPKRIIGNMDRAFIADRQVALEKYLNEILMNPIIGSSLPVRQFLDPENYSANMQEQAIQHVLMALRSEVNYEFLKPLPEIGWRIRKHYFAIKARLHPKAEMALQYVDYGPDKHLDNNSIHNMLKALVLLNHPHILKLEMAHCSELGCFVVRKFEPEGSLRDFISCSKPIMSFVRKYGNPLRTKCLTVREISEYGRQILDTLIFLSEKNIPYGHLHTGNVLLSDGQVKLLDIENSILGLSSYYRPYFAQYRKINSSEAIDVYCFGHVLFEMITGQPLLESFCDNLPQCDPHLRIVLSSILSPKSLRTGLPTLKELRKTELFTPPGIPTPIKINFKISAALKEAVQKTVEDIILRLQDEQKAIRQQKRLAKVEKMLSVDEQVTERSKERKKDKVKSPARSDSLTSTSTITSAETTTPPSISGSNNNRMNGADKTPRSALLSSICSFDRSQLKRRVSTNGTVVSN